MSFAVEKQSAVPNMPTGAQSNDPCIDQAELRQGHEFEFNPNPLTRTWVRLESTRLKKLGITKNYSRHFNVTRSYNGQSPPTSPRSGYTDGEPPQQKACNLSQFSGAPVNTGSFAPFHSQGKPTCGFFFSRDTDNKKQRIGIPAANLVKWRSFNSEEHH